MNMKSTDSDMKEESQNEVNLFGKPMSEKEQSELSDLLNKFLITYEDEFDCLIGDIEEDIDYLKDEFKRLYEMVSMLSGRMNK